MKPNTRRIVFLFVRSYLVVHKTPHGVDNEEEVSR
jgi:hypothetical protein